MRNLRSSSTFVLVGVLITLGCTSSEPDARRQPDTALTPELSAPVVASLEPDSETLARNAGILGVMQQEPGALQSSPGCILIGDDDDDVWAGLDDLPPTGGKRVPLVRLAKAQVGEGLDRDVVRRIVRGHIAEVRSCYEAGLARAPMLAGRVEIAFEILASGEVGSSSVHATSLAPADERVAACIAKAAKRWAFPRPQSGEIVDVIYPFALAPD